MFLPYYQFTIIVSLLAATSARADGIYTKDSPVLQVDHRNYDQLITKSNYVSVVEFYAPWCGHCNKLKPAYEKVAENLKGLAKVAAVNCDNDDNKPLCGQMGVEGYPTLKIMVPTKKHGKPLIQDYTGRRSAKAITESVVDKIPNHVTKLTDKDFDEWLSKDPETHKVILFTDKGTTGALIRTLAIDFLGSVDVAQVRNKEKKMVKRFGVTEFPSVILLPGGSSDPIVYDRREFKKEPLVEFISQVAKPNLDPALEKSSKSSSKAAHSSTRAEDGDRPTEPSNSGAALNDPEEDKSAHAKSNSIGSLTTPADLESACLSLKANTCVLVILPESKEPDSKLSEPAQTVITSLAEIAHKHSTHNVKIFPFYAVPATNEAAKTLRTGLSLPEDDESIQVIALNGRRGWWRRYNPSDKPDFGLASVEAWIDSIRLGEGSREKLPEGVIATPRDGAAKEEQVEHDEL